MNTEDSEFARLEREALLRASQPVVCHCDSKEWCEMYSTCHRKTCGFPPAQPVRPQLDQGPDYERGFVDGMQYQMQSSVDKAVNAGAENLRDWVAERMDEESEQPVRPQRPWVGINKEEAFELLKKHEGRPFSLSAAVENLLREKNYG